MTLNEIQTASTFDYGALDVEARIVVQQKTGEIHERVDTVRRSVIEVGQRLIEVKVLLKHGQYGDWLRAEFGWSQDTAERMVNVARLARQIPQIAEFEDQIARSALTVLAKPSTPPAAVQEVVELAEKGVDVTHALAQEVIDEHKSAEESGYIWGDNHHTPMTDAEVTAFGFPEPAISQTHPFFSGQSSGSATCTACGEVHARWTAAYEGNWRCGLCGEMTPDADMRPYTRQQRIAEERGKKKKPRTNRAGSTTAEQPTGWDACQTPSYALHALEPFMHQVKAFWNVWEPACGEGLLVDGLHDYGFANVMGTDLLTGQNFFSTQLVGWDVQITNPPYTIKYDWLARSYALQMPFALLMPIDVFGSKQAQDLFDRYGVEVILMDERIDFKMPERGWNGSGAHFSTAWFTWGLSIGRVLSYARITEAKKKFVEQLIERGEKL